MKIDIEEVIQDEGLETDDADWLRAQPPQAAYLIKEGMAYICCHHQHEFPVGMSWADACNGKPHGKFLGLNMGDTFGYACSDSEEVKGGDLEEVVRIYKRYGPTGLICWASKQRNEAPVIEYTEDPVYQATWKAFYGDLSVEENFCNRSDPRWSDSKLNLAPWK